MGISKIRISEMYTPVTSADLLSEVKDGRPRGGVVHVGRQLCDVSGQLVEVVQQRTQRLLQHLTQALKAGVGDWGYTVYSGRGTRVHMGVHRVQRRGTICTPHGCQSIKISTDDRTVHL